MYVLEHKRYGKNIGDWCFAVGFFGFRARALRWVRTYVFLAFCVWCAVVRLVCLAAVVRWDSFSRYRDSQRLIVTRTDWMKARQAGAENHACLADSHGWLRLALRAVPSGSVLAEEPGCRLERSANVGWEPGDVFPGSPPATARTGTATAMITYVRT